MKYQTALVISPRYESGCLVYAFDDEEQAMAAMLGEINANLAELNEPQIEGVFSEYSFDTRNMHYDLAEIIPQ